MPSDIPYEDRSPGYEGLNEDIARVRERLARVETKVNIAAYIAGATFTAVIILLSQALHI